MKNLQLPQSEHTHPQPQQPSAVALTSNRGSQGILHDTSTPILDQSGYQYGTAGIDKIRLTIPLMITDTNRHALMANLINDAAKTKGETSIEGFDTVYVTYLENPQKAVQIEFNPSKRDGFPVPLCPFEELDTACYELITKLIKQSNGTIHPTFLAQPYIDTGRTWKHEVAISRIDIARDFYISDDRFELEQLRDRHPKRMKACTLILIGNVVNTVTHPRSKDSHQVKMYNKSEESKRKGDGLPPGYYRFEVNLPRKQVKINYIEKMLYATPETLNFILEKYWENSRYGEPMKCEINALELISSRFGVQQALNMIKIHNDYILGHTFSSNATFRKVLKAFRTIGINPHKALCRQETPYGYICLERGTLI